MISSSYRTRRSQFCTLAAALAILGVFAAPAAAQLVPYGQGGPGTPGYRYKIVEHGAERGFELLPCNETWTLDDSPWFGLGANCEPPTPNCNKELCPIFAEAETDWLPADSDLLVCYTLTLCGAQDSITDVSLALDNDAAVWVDGVKGTVTGGIGENGDSAAPFCWSGDIAGPFVDTNGNGLSDEFDPAGQELCMTENCAVPDKVVFTFPAGTGEGPGPHTIHVRARDRHALAYLDIEVNGRGTAGPCPEVCEGCITRTPGYWGAHPDITQRFLPLENCGIPITNTGAFPTFPPFIGSAIEDLCSHNRDAKDNDGKFNNNIDKSTSPQQLQLIRQCMAAHLNLAASAFFEGGCANELGALSELFDGATIDECCGPTICGGDLTGSEISETSCIDFLDAFNNSDDTHPTFTDFCPNAALGTEPPCNADPASCSQASGNSWLNPPPDRYGPK